MHQCTGTASAGVMACRMIGTKPLPKPMLPCCQLDSNSKVQWNLNKYVIFSTSRTCIWKWRLKIDQTFVRDSTYYVRRHTYWYQSIMIAWGLHKMLSPLRWQVKMYWIHGVFTVIIPVNGLINWLKFISEVIQGHMSTWMPKFFPRLQNHEAPEAKRWKQSHDEAKIYNNGWLIWSWHDLEDNGGI